MDIQIKYKEVDKKAEVLRLIEGYRTGFGCNSSATLNAIDKLYKEESKEIEYIDIKPLGIMLEQWQTRKLLWMGTEKETARLEKSQVAELIKGLQNLYIQMD
jgi:hypothetical protein